MITQSHPAPEVQRQQSAYRPRTGTTWLLAFAVSLALCAAAAVDNLNQRPWVETFAPAHPNHPRGY